MLSINSIGRKCHGNSICKYTFLFRYDLLLHMFFMFSNILNSIYAKCATDDILFVCAWFL